MANTETNKIAIIGFGNIGSGVADIIVDLQKKGKAYCGKQFELGYILDIRSFEGHSLEKYFIKDFETIVNDKDVSVVIETIGGTNPAYKFVKQSLLAKKSVVTSNKELVATYGTELLQIAFEQGVSFRFEASVGGAMPTIAPLLDTYCAGEVESIYAIINGTTNFMLTRMEKQGISFEEALKVAQDLGYAETKDPSDDVDGIDAKRKISIIASIASKHYVSPDVIKNIGIANVELCDLKKAAENNGTIKLIAYYKKEDSKSIMVGVEPMFVKNKNAFKNVSDVFNGMIIDHEFAGRIFVSGRGAGKYPTASVVVSDTLRAMCDNPRLPCWGDAKPGIKVSELKPEQYFVIQQNGNKISASIVDKKDFKQDASYKKVFKVLN